MLARGARSGPRFRLGRSAAPAPALEPDRAIRLADAGADLGGDPRDRRPHARATAPLGIEMVLLYPPRWAPASGRACCASSALSGTGVVVEVDDPPTHPLQPLDESAQRLLRARVGATCTPPRSSSCSPRRPRRPGPTSPRGVRRARPRREGRLVPGRPPPATNTRGVVVGLMRNHTERYPEGMMRVSLFGDPTRALGSLAEPECRRIIAALDLAERLGVPAEWFALSAGAKIAMDSGTENMDWIAAVLRRIVEFTQAAESCQRGRHRDQRRGAALLERRGDDADAHPGHPRHDARERDGADRQAGAGLLRRRLGRGQLRHRRLRADHGAQRAGAVLGRGPRGRLPAAAGALRAHLRGARASASASGLDHRPDRPRRARGPALAPGTSSGASARSSPTRPTRAARSRSTSAR